MYFYPFSIQALRVELDRYKLGAGGLVRAYTDAVAGALLHADKIEHIATAHLHALVAFEFEGAARRLAAKLAATLQATHASQGVSLHIALPCSHAHTFVTQLNDISSGQVQWLDHSA